MNKISSGIPEVVSAESIQNGTSEAGTAPPIGRADIAKFFSPPRKPRNAERSVTLAELRGMVGKSQVDVAEVLHVTQSTLSKIESKSDMRISSLRSYAEALGVECKIVAILNGRSFNLVI